MADLLPSLLIPSPRSSQDSFRSFSSEPQPPTSQSHSANQNSSTPQRSAFETAGLPIYDVDTYLNDPKNAAPQAASNNGSKASKKSGSTNAGNPEPVLLGTRTTHHVATLNQQCQAKGFLPIFEIEGDESNADFGGILKLGVVEVESDRRWKSKKEAREGLAERGLKVLQEIEAVKKVAGTQPEPGKNWIGMLLEYHNLHNPNQGPLYQDYALGLAFASTCTIPSLPDKPFGSPTNACPSKKAARSNAAREAVEYLIDNGELNPDGSTKTRKKVKVGPAVKLQGGGFQVKKGLSYAQKVNDMCPLLGLTTPSYVLTPASALAPNMLSGYATFSNESLMPDQIGEVRNIFGKKNAKEEIAKEVWEVLRQLARKRGVPLEEREGSGDGGESG